MMQYVKEAPLLALTGMARVKLQRHRVEAVDAETAAVDIQAIVKNLDAKLTEMKRRLKHLEAVKGDDLDVHEDVHDEVPDNFTLERATYILNLESDCLHLKSPAIAITKSGARRWTTLCKWPYEDRAHERLSVGEQRGNKCRRCWDIFEHFDGESAEGE